MNEPLPQPPEPGTPVALNDLVPLIYTELRGLAAAKMAGEKPGQTLQATALVHEVWIRLGGDTFANKAHFFASASEAMRRILIERARRKAREKRGGGSAIHVDLDEVEIALPEGNEDEALAVNEALDQLAVAYPHMAELVKLRYFVGLSFEEVSEVMGVSLTTAKRDWTYARAWLHRKIIAGG